MNTTLKTSVGVMQPYIFPYIGYFQLAAASDHFVFYDDVQYIKRGWINRNRITDKGKDALFTVPAIGGTQSALIMDVTCGADAKWVKKLGITLQHEYKKAPHYAAVNDLVLGVFDDMLGKPISELAIRSVEAVFEYLDEPFTTIRSSVTYPNETGLRRADRIIDIAKKCGGKTYINLPGGAALYADEDFAEHDMELLFILEHSRSYQQFNYDFVPKLSIIDILMHNDKDVVREMLRECSFVKRDAL